MGLDHRPGRFAFRFREGSRLRENLERLAEFLAHPFVDVAAVTAGTADRFGRIALELERAGTPFSTNDVWIAAHALELGAELMTLDDPFSRMTALVVA